MRKTAQDNASKSSDSSRISSQQMQNIINKLISNQNRKSTRDNYLRIWRQFNKFVINLDRKPILWEDRVAMFIAYKIEDGMQSSTVKSYISAIKKGPG